MKTSGLAALPNILSLLRALQWNYWTAHWQVQGDPFYGDHLLFERLYNNMQEEIDTLAEKIVYLLGRESVNPVSIDLVSSDYLQRYCTNKSLYLRSLEMEQALQETLKIAYKTIKESGGMTLGLDDYIMALANSHEGHLYLLNNRLVCPVVP